LPTAGVVFGTASAAAFGLGDFLGALAARRSPALLVAAGGQLVGLIALSAAALVLRPALPDAAGIALAVAAGVAGATGISALYRGMAVAAW